MEASASAYEEHEERRQAAREAQRHARDFWNQAARAVDTSTFETPARRNRSEAVEHRHAEVRTNQRQAETEDERDERRERNRRAAAARRQRVCPRARDARGLMTLDPDCRFLESPGKLSTVGRVTPHSVGTIGAKACQHCAAQLFGDERDSMCCENGKVVVDPFPHPTPRLRQLLEGNDTDSKALKNNIRALNCALSFASLTVTHSTPAWGRGRYNPNIVIAGQSYYNIGPVQASPGGAPRNAQVNFENDSYLFIGTLDVLYFII
jgi:hypothetical protein